MKALEEKVYALKEMGLNARAIHFLFLILTVVLNSKVYTYCAQACALLNSLAADTMERHLKPRLQEAFSVGNRRTFWWCIAISPLTLYLGL